MKNTKRILACFLAVLMTLSCFTVMSVGADNAPSESASVYDPSVTATLSEAVDGVIYIDSANEFMAFKDALNGGNNFANTTIKLTCDVVINQGDVSTWTNPIKWSGYGGSWDNRFAGNFDGQGHTISGIYNVHDNSVGLFGRAASGTYFKDVNIVNSYFKTTGTNIKGVGGLIGNLDAGATGNVLTTTITNVHVNATIEAANVCTGVGGIVGSNALFDNSTLIIENCSFNGAINTPKAENVGGIVGYMNTGKELEIENCSVSAAINGGSMVGGFVGHLNACDLTLSNCLVKGTVDAKVLITGGTTKTKYRSSPIIGFTQVNKNMTVKIGSVVAAVKLNSYEALITTMYERKSGENPPPPPQYTVYFEFDNIVYDQDVQTPACYIRRDNDNNALPYVNGTKGFTNGNWELDGGNSTGQIAKDKFNVTAKASSELKGQQVFAFWTAVDGDYPTPPTVSVDSYNGVADSAYVTAAYDAGDTIVINTAEQFMGFKEVLNSGKNFAGKTIKLNTNIAIAQGDASTWGTTAPAGTYHWSGFGGGWGTRFAGNIDGQGHTISGIYNSNENSAGLFGRSTGASQIKNLNIVNSYFRSTGTGENNQKAVGAIFGHIEPSNGEAVTTTLSNVHVDAIVVNEGPDDNKNYGSGGLVGGTYNYANSKLVIENCSFNGTINAPATVKVGGLVGYMKGIDLIIENSTVNATITCKNSVGGFVGTLESSNIMISNCFAEGTINATVANGSGKYRTSPIIGYIDLWGKNMYAEISNVLTAISFSTECETAIATLRGSGDYTVNLILDNVVYDSTLMTPTGLARRDNGNAPKSKVNNSDVMPGAGKTNYYLNGTGDSQIDNSYFDTTGKSTSELKGKKIFDHWTAVEGDYPTPPTTFVPDAYSGTPSTAYVTAGDTVTIYTAEQLMGFADAIVNGNSFSGKTIKLNRDIIINKGDASTWGTNAPAYTWNAFSTYLADRFAGNFDGQGHVISGIYNNHNTAAGLFGRATGGNTIQNVSIVNSYFESTGVSGDTGAGAIFGIIDTYQKDGTATITLSNVHVEANVVGFSSNVHSTGGLVGRTNNYDSASMVIENCSFNGTVTAAGTKAGGLIGNISAANLSITNCSVNASITAQKTAGGLVGRALKVNNTTISDCLVVADINTSEADTTNGVIGYYSSEYGAGVANISDTLVSVRGENVLSIVLGFWGKDGKTLNVTLDNVKYDSNRFNGTKARDIYHDSSVKDLIVKNYTVGEDLVDMSFDQIKGNAIFDGWTAVKGDYPVPTSAIDPLKAFVFESYGSATEVLGYQIKNNGDGTYGVRLIATLTNALDTNYIAAGFKDIKVTLTNGEVKVQPIYHCMYSYNSVMGGGATYNAADYLADKFFCLTIDNAPATIASIEATPFVMTGESAEPVCGEAVSWTLVETEPADQITVMSLNVYLHADADPDGDGPATAQHRLNGIKAQVLAADPDVLCVQEDNWSETLDELLIDNGYTAVRGKAISRSSSDSLGISYTYEYLTIYYKTGEFTVGAKGQKWLSATPDTQYSDSYGNENTRPRGFNYVELTSVATGETFFVFNTHLENSSIGTRKDQANKLIELVGQIAGETPYIICGDFNVSSNPNDESGNADHKATLSALLAAFDNTRLTAALTDTHATHINAEGKIFGVADKTVTPTSGTIIDYCFTSKGDFNVYSYDVVAEKQNGIYTSDHLPIVIKLAIKSAE